MTHETVGFKTADPVSGTVATIWTTGSSTEQTEPIGQVLHLIDPEAPPQPIPPDTMIRSADFPQWRCEEQNARFMWGNFNGWPEECRKRYMQDMDLPQDQPGDAKEESPEKIGVLIMPTGLTDAGSDAGMVLATRTMMSRALTSSSKEDSSKECPAGTDLRVDDKGIPQCVGVGENTVTVTPERSIIDISNTGGADASVSGWSDDQKLIDSTIADVKSIFNQDNDCSRYFEQAILVASSSEVINGKTTVENFYIRWDAARVADALGAQLKVSLLPKGKDKNTSIGIQMYSDKVEKTIINSSADDLEYQTFEHALVNVRGPFLGSGRMGNYSGRAGRALMILHEIAHMIRSRGANPRSPLIPNETGDEDNRRKMSVESTELVEEKCKKELNALSN